VGVYQEKLDYYIPFDLKERRDNGREIVTNIERYRDLLDMLKRYQNEEFAAQKIAVFNNYLEEFSNLYGERRTRGGR